MISQLVSAYLLLKLKRRILYIVSCILTGAGMFAFATTNYLNSSSKAFEQSTNLTIIDSHPDTDETITVGQSIGWLPLAAIMLVAVGYHIGLSPITWSYTGKKYMKVSNRYLFSKAKSSLHPTILSITMTSLYIYKKLSYFRWTYVLSYLELLIVLHHYMTLSRSRPTLS